MIQEGISRPAGPRILLVLVAVAAAVAIFWTFAPELGLLTPHDDAVLVVEQTSAPSDPLHLDPALVEQEAPSLHDLLQEALLQGQASTTRSSQAKAAWSYLSQISQGWNGHDLEWQGHYFAVTYQTS